MVSSSLLAILLAVTAIRCEAVRAILSGIEMVDNDVEGIKERQLELTKKTELEFTMDRALTVDNEKESDAAEVDNEKEADTTESPADVRLAQSILVERCLEERVADWRGLHERLGLENPSRSGGGYMKEALDQLHAAEEKIANFRAGRTWWDKYLHPEWKNPEVGRWQMELSNAKSALQNEGFWYDYAKKRCKKGANEASYKCMMQHACPGDKTTCDLAKTVRARVDARDLQETRYMLFLDWDVRKKSRKWVSTFNEILEKADYSWKAHKLECRKQMEDSIQLMHEKVMKELRVGEETGEECAEADDKFCPEGTFVTTARRFNHVRGDKVTGITSSIMKVILMPAGMASSWYLAGALGWLGPMLINTAANQLVGPISVAAGYLASRGPEECACFPRDCEFNQDKGICETELDANSPTKNPFGAALPMPAMKCVQQRSEFGDPLNSCTVMPCSEDDFSATLLKRGTDGGGKTGLYGIIGRPAQDKASVYNCLSSSGSPAGALAFAANLPSGSADTPLTRNMLLRSLSISERGVLRNVSIAKPGTTAQGGEDGKARAKEPEPETSKGTVEAH